MATAMTAVEVLETSITTLQVDAITNAANTALQNIGGVALAIVQAGGRSPAGSDVIQDECDKIIAERVGHKIGLGEAVSTGAGELPCKWVIHAATMELGETSSAATISLATRNTVQLADRLGANSLGLVALGIGIGQVKPDDAALAMTDAIRQHLAQGSSLRRIVFTIKDPAALEPFRTAVQQAFPHGQT